MDLTFIQTKLLLNTLNATKIRNPANKTLLKFTVWDTYFSQLSKIVNNFKRSTNKMQDVSAYNNIKEKLKRILNNFKENFSRSITLEYKLEKSRVKLRGKSVLRADSSTSGWFLGYPSQIPNNGMNSSRLKWKIFPYQSDYF